ncbi:MAG: hypothetical protein NXI02_10595 [Rhodobacteraceae bacterium]|nr:hypothetical protein [Paracoccaceae bacterium]
MSDQPGLLPVDVDIEIRILRIEVDSRDALNRLCCFKLWIIHL